MTTHELIYALLQGTDGVHDIAHKLWAKTVDSEKIVADLNDQLVAVRHDRDCQAAAANSHRDRVAELEAACADLEMDAADAGALVVSHEGRIDELEKRIAELEKQLIGNRLHDVGVVR